MCEADLGVRNLYVQDGWLVGKFENILFIPIVKINKAKKIPSE